MLSRVAGLLRPPEFEDDDRRRAAEILHVVLWVFLGGALLYTAATLDLAVPLRWRIPLFALPAVFAGGLAAVRKGRIRPTALGLVGLLFALGLFGMLSGGGVRAPGFGVLFVGAILAGQVLDWRSAALVAAVSTAIPLGVHGAVAAGLLGPPRFVHPEAAWVMGMTTCLAVSGLLAAFGSRRAHAMLRRVRSEQRTRFAAVERFAEFVRLAPDGIVTVDAEGRIAEANPAQGRILGLPRERIVGRHFRDFLAPDEADDAEDRFRGALTGSADIGLHEVPILREDGRRIVVEAHPRALGPESGPSAMVVVVRDVTARVEAQRQKEAESEERRRAEERLAEAHGQLRQLVRRLESTREEERRRLARELHDELGQELTVLKILIHRAVVSPGAWGEDEALRSVDAIIDGVRSLSRTVRPPLLDERGLLPALRALARDHARRIGVEIEVTSDGTTRRLDPEVEAALFRIAQEGLTNAIRHAGPARIRLTVRTTESAAEISVTDDGRGFETALGLARAVDEGRLGLLGIRERAAALGGAAEVRSAPGSGTTLVAWVPAPSPRGMPGISAGA